MKQKEYRAIENLLEDNAALLKKFIDNSTKAMASLAILKSYIDEDDFDEQIEILDSITRRFGYITRWLRKLRTEMIEDEFWEKTTELPISSKDTQG